MPDIVLAHLGFDEWRAEVHQRAGYVEPPKAARPAAPPSTPSITAAPRIPRRPRKRMTDHDTTDHVAK